MPLPLVIYKFHVMICCNLVWCNNRSYISDRSWHKKVKTLIQCSCIRYFSWWKQICVMWLIKCKSAFILCQSSFCILFCQVNFFGCSIIAHFKQRDMFYSSLCRLHESFYLPPVFEKWPEVLFWGLSPYPPSPPSKPTFCLISQLLLKLAFWNLTCAKYAKTILLKCF